MIKQILKKELPKGVGRSFILFQWPLTGYRDIFFEATNWQKSSQGDIGFWDYVQDLNKAKDSPRGVMQFTGLDNERYFRATYFPTEITEENIITWLKTKFY